MNRRWFQNALGAIVFTCIVAVSVRSDSPPLPCAPDGKNYATATSTCVPNEQIKACGDYNPGDNGSGCPNITTLQKFQGEFYCYPSDTNGGVQSTNCVWARNPDGTWMSKNCRVKQKCKAVDRGSILHDWVCENDGASWQTTEFVYTNSVCAPFVGPVLPPVHPEGD